MNLAATILLAAAVLGLPGAASAAGLRQFSGNSRILVIVSDGDERRLTQQKRLLAGDGDGLADRDMVVLILSGDSVAPFFGRHARVDAAQLRSDAGIASDTPFAVVLVGKDGGVKLRRSEPVSTDDLFALIDSMPMRARERNR